jgi:hypothetical protein
MVALLASTVCLVCAFFLYVLIQFRREQTRPRRKHQRESSHVVRIGGVNANASHERQGGSNHRSGSGPVAALVALILIPACLHGQEAQPAASQPATQPMQAQADKLQTAEERERNLLGRVAMLEKRIAELEARTSGLPPLPSSKTEEAKDSTVANDAAANSVLLNSAAAIANAPAAATQQQASDPPEAGHGIADFLHGTTFNGTLDGYYEYNFNSPAGRVNLLRAYDVSSNSFSLNQATFVIERAADLSEDRRFGVRVDLQYGQATETLQGNAANEPRPNVYRPVFQAYGTYIAPVGSGLTIDFGKWESALGIENNYTKDEMNYSRSYLFDFLPFYHMGVRAAYNLTPKVNVAYWLANGAEQTEDFNGFKSQAFIFTLKPVSAVTWNVNYYFGQEQRDVVQVLNPGLPTEPTQPGLPTTPVTPVPNGREHILDTYATWNASSKWTFAGEADYVIDRVFSSSAPQHDTGGAAYARYQWTPKLAFAARSEYLSDRGGLFSGKTQALKEVTLTTEYKFAEGFLMREEWRRDFSNQPFFLTNEPGELKKEQNTATIGLVWWFGQKQGAW